MEGSGGVGWRDLMKDERRSVVLHSKTKPWTRIVALWLRRDIYLYISHALRNFKMFITPVFPPSNLQHDKYDALAATVTLRVTRSTY